MTNSAAAMGFTSATKADATTTTCPPSWFEGLLPDHESDRIMWQSMLPVQAMGRNVPSKAFLALKIHTVAILSHRKDCVAERELADQMLESVGVEIKRALVIVASAADRIERGNAEVSDLKEKKEKAREKILAIFNNDDDEPLGEFRMINMGFFADERDMINVDLKFLKARLEKMNIDHYAAERTAEDYGDNIQKAEFKLALATREAKVAAVEAIAEAAAAGIHIANNANSEEIASAVAQAKAAVNQYLTM